MSGFKLKENEIEFISNWKNRTDQQQKKYLWLSLCSLLLAFVVCLSLFFWYQSENYTRIVENNMNYIQDSAKQETNQVESEMSNAVNLVSNLARQYASLCATEENTTVEEKLNLIDESALFDHIAFVSRTGEITNYEDTKNIVDRRYFRNAMRGQSGWEALGVSRVTGKPSIVFYSPVIIDDEIIGVIIGFYEQEKIDEMFSYQFFNYEPDTYLLLGDGTLIAASDYTESSDNMLEYLSEKNFTGDVEYNQLTEIIKDRSKITTTFSFVDGKKTKVGTVVQFENNEMMILSVMPSEVVDSMISRANRLGRTMLSSVIITFFLVLVVIMFIFKKQRKHLEEEIEFALENLVSTVESEKRQLSIIQSLVDIYSSVYYIDLVENTYERINEKQVSSLVFAETGDADTAFKGYVKAFVHDNDQKSMSDFLNLTTCNERLAKAKSISIEYLRSDEKWRRANFVVAERNDDGEPVAVIFAVQGIDEEKELEIRTQRALQQAYEAAQLASEAKTTFLSNMSHDIRTPMNAIIGMTAIAGTEIDNPEKVSYCLKKITSSSRHLLALINEVLDMSKIESGKVDLLEEDFSLPDLIENLVAMHQSLIEEKHHELSVKVIDVTNENVIGDYTRLQQVLTNLLSNAIKYTPDGGKINILLREKDTNKNNIGMFEFVIEDNGIGMTEEFQKNMFEPFTRASDSRIIGIQGTGLGMPIAKNIIRMMNGDIAVESKINKGSKFTVNFVLKLQTTGNVTNEAFVDLPVLVVDDDEAACETACSILDSLEMKSEYVMSGVEAVEKTVERHIIDDDYYAVIIDWKMPDMNGIDTTREIRKKVGKDIPIIVISSYDWTDIEQEAKEAGVNAFLRKPLFKSRVASLFNDLITDGKQAHIEYEKAEPVTFDGRRVLLVEDNEINREITIELLSMIGIETEFAVNGQEGVEKFVSSEPGYYDLIFMDIQMPVMDGCESTIEIRRSEHPNAANIPIIAMTANAFATDVKKAFDVGMNAHISKPIDLDRIVQTLDEQLNNKK